jgi:Na+/melibiose symporter-like transporter
MCTQWPFWGLFLFCSSTWLLPPTLNLQARLDRQHVNHFMRNVACAVGFLALLLIAQFARLNQNVAWEALIIALGVYAIASVWWSYLRSGRVASHGPT